MKVLHSVATCQTRLRLQPTKPLLNQVYLLAGRLVGVLSVVLMMTVVAGCSRQPTSEVVVYAALDEEFSKPILEKFTEDTGIRVKAAYDVESTKSVQLTQRIVAESQRPRCDVFWNNELLNTLRLKRSGLLDLYRSPVGADYPTTYRAKDGSWHGFAARARVLLVNRDLVAEEHTPSSILDLTHADWKGRIAIAKPLAGTTATHAACLFSVWGEAKAKDFFRRLSQNARVVAGNKQVARAVATGQAAYGLTDTDDAIGEIESGMPVEIVYPDQGDGQFGTLFIPNTVAIIRNGPNRDAAVKLVDYLLSAEVEQALAEGPSAQIPLNSKLDLQLRIKTPKKVRPMEVDFSAAAEQWDTAAGFLRDEFASAN